MRLRTLCTLGLLALPALAFGQTGYNITGALSNFDCHNRCDDPCDEFEIEIEDIQPQDVIGCYRNSNYGSPTVTRAANETFTRIDYRHPQHLTAVGTVEHFGVSVRNFNNYSAIRVRWMRNGAPATVNGQIPNPGGGTAPATQPRLPSITSDMTVDGDGLPAMGLLVTNTDLTQAIWVKRRALVSTNPVTLEQLMPNDPHVTSTLELDAAPIMITAGNTVSLVSDLIEIEEQQSIVFTALYYQDLVNGGPFGTTHNRGPELGNVMTATIASPNSVCGTSGPAFLAQPASVTADLGHRVILRADVDGNDLPVTYQWFRNGQALTNNASYDGATTEELTIEALTEATEGFFRVHATTSCGTSDSDSALVFITGHNEPPPPPPHCVADFDDGTFTGTPDGGVTIDDLIFYLFIFDLGDVTADIDDGTFTNTLDGGVTIDDLIYYLFRFDAGC